MKLISIILFLLIFTAIKAQPITLPGMETRWMTFIDGGDALRFEFKGTNIDKKGNLLVAAGISNEGNENFISQEAYQTTTSVAFNYCIFKLDTLGKLNWGTYFGTAGILGGRNMTIDSAENIILTGNVCQYCEPGGQAIITPNAQTSSIPSQTYTRPNGSVREANTSDGFVAKLTSSGGLAWSTYQGGRGFDQICAVSTDKKNNLYVAGKTNSLENIATHGTHRSFYADSITSYNQPEWYWSMSTAALYLVKYDSLGNKLWGTYFGGVQPDSVGGSSKIYDMKTDANGNILICGIISRTATGFVTEGLNYQNLCDTCTQGIFISKFSQDGNRLWGIYYPIEVFNSSATPFNCHLFVRQNDIFLLGNTTTKGLGTEGVYQKENKGGSDAFITKFNTNGIREWHTYLGGPGDEILAYSTMPISEETGSLYISGITTSQSGFSDSISAYNTLRAGFNTFVAKFGLGGSKQWLVYTSPESASTLASALSLEGSVATNNTRKFYQIRSNRAYDAQPSTYTETVQPNPTSVGFITHYLTMLVDTSAHFHDPADTSVIITTPPQVDTLDKDSLHINLYPNPSSGDFTLQGIPLQKDPHRYALFNAVGKLIDRKLLVQAPVQHFYYGNKLAPGLYFLRLENSATGKQISFKMVVL